MTEEFKAELYLNDGSEFRSVRLRVQEDGSLRLDAQDMGPAVERVWGHDDYEFSVDVTAVAMPKLVFVRFREKYANESHAVDLFNEFCEREGIEHHWMSWT